MAAHRYFLTAALIATVGSGCYAETPMERSARIIEEASRQAASDRQLVRPAAGPLPAQEKPPTAMPVDPGEIASRYRDRFQPKMPSDELLVFISTGMPKEALRRLGSQVAAAGGVLVLRGFKGGLARGAMAETLKEVKPLVDAGARIEINPEAFSHFSVTVVPTYVIAMRQEGCTDAKCSWQGPSLVGDVSLSYALEHWVDQGGRIGAVAQRYLDLIEREGK